MSQVLRRVVMMMAKAVSSIVYATLDPTHKGVSMTLSGGNLTMTTGTTLENVRSTVGPTSGKYYFEYSGFAYSMVGICNATESQGNGVGTTANSIGYMDIGLVKKNGATVATYASYSSSDVIGVAIDASTGGVTFYKNNVLQGSPGTITGSQIWAVFGNRAAADATGTVNFGATPLTYSPPAGYNAGLY